MPKATPALLLLVAITVPACSGQHEARGVAGPGGGTKPILIGVAGPLTDPLGVSQLRGARLAVSQINARGGVRGRRLELRALDDSGTPDVAVRVAQTLYQDAQVVAVVGHVTSGTSVAAARVYGGGSNPVVMFSPTASSPDLSGVSPFFFRACPTDVSHGPALARYARENLGARRASVIYSNDDYGRGIRRLFDYEFARLGGLVLEEDPYVETTHDLEPFLSRMRLRGGVDVLVLAGEPVGGELVLRQMQRLGVHWPVIGGDGLTGIESRGALAEGVRVSVSYLPDRRGPKNAAFTAEYARTYDGQRPDDTVAGTYDAVMLLAQAIEAAGSDRRAIRDYLAQVGRGRPAYEGVTGPIAFDTMGDVPAKGVLIGIVRHGQLVSEVAR